MRFHGHGSTRQSKFSAVMGLLAGIGIVLAGLGFLFEPGLGIGIFLATWVVLFVFQLYQSASNVFGDDGVPHESSKFSGNVSGTGVPDQPDFAEKLRDLQALKDDDLISDEEFERKRREIMSEKW